MRFFLAKETEKEFAKMSPHEQGLMGTVLQKFKETPFPNIISRLDRELAPGVFVRKIDFWNIVYGRAKTKDGSEVAIITAVVRDKA